MGTEERVKRYSIETIRLLNTLPKNISNRIISEQLLRSATSIGANIIEAKASNSRKDFVRFFHYALKSANESSYWLDLLRNTLESDIPSLPYLTSETKELANIIASSLLTLKGKK